MYYNLRCHRTIVFIIYEKNNLGYGQLIFEVKYLFTCHIYIYMYISLMGWNILLANNDVGAI